VGFCRDVSGNSCRYVYRSGPPHRVGRWCCRAVRILWSTPATVRQSRVPAAVYPLAPKLASPSVPQQPYCFSASQHSYRYGNIERKDSMGSNSGETSGPSELDGKNKAAPVEMPIYYTGARELGARRLSGQPLTHAVRGLESNPCENLASLKPQAASTKRPKRHDETPASQARPALEGSKHLHPFLKQHQLHDHTPIKLRQLIPDPITQP